jgi:mono/diheme cytochrome c family protein
MKTRMIGAMALALVATGCNLGRDGQSIGQYAPNMFDSPALKTQGVNRIAALADSGMNNVPVQAIRTPAAGTVAMNSQPYPFAKGGGDSIEIVRALVGEQLPNPLPRTAAVLERGKFVFQTYCTVCHGTWGVGDGPVVDPYPKPLSIQSTKVHNYKDGAIFHVVWYGNNAMPGYAKQIPARDIWAAIHYIRSLQKAFGAPDDAGAQPAAAADSAKASTSTTANKS